MTGFGHPDWVRTHEPSSRTSPVVLALVEGGATCVGKTVVDELAYRYLPSKTIFGNNRLWIYKNVLGLRGMEVEGSDRRGKLEGMVYSFIFLMLIQNYPFFDILFNSCTFYCSIPSPLLNQTRLVTCCLHFPSYF